jgi:hypothetical protein
MFIYHRNVSVSIVVAIIKKCNNDAEIPGVARDSSK